MAHVRAPSEGRATANGVLRRRALPPADDRRGAHARRGRSASRSWSAIRRTFDFARGRIFGVLVQYPATDGARPRLRAARRERAHAARRSLVVAADLLALTLLRAAGRVRRGRRGRHRPSASACRWATAARTRRSSPRATSTSARCRAASSASRKDAHGQARRCAWRCRRASSTSAARRRPATSAPRRCCSRSWPACTPSTTGRRGCSAIAERVHALAAALAAGLRAARATRLGDEPFFDTLRVELGGAERRRRSLAARRARRINLRRLDDGTRRRRARRDDHGRGRRRRCSRVFAGGERRRRARELARRARPTLPGAARAHERATSTHPVFNRYHSETRDAALHASGSRRATSRSTHSMIPLGSCTMKLNATAEMIPVTWPEFAHAAPVRAAPSRPQGYRELFARARARGSPRSPASPPSRCSRTPARRASTPGLLVIRALPRGARRGAPRRLPDPASAHGTNPAQRGDGGHEGRRRSPATSSGNIDVADLRGEGRASTRDSSRALMVTYPSTHGVFEEAIREICEIVHEHGGQVYMDGANMNAQVGLCRPGDIGADVCHLNLHKTFCIPHGGGGPGMGPIGVAAHLAPFLPGHPVVATRRRAGDRPGVGGAVGQRAASCRSPGCTSRMMGGDGLTRATRGRDPQRQLHRQAARAALPGALPRRATAASRTSASSTCARSRRRAGVEVEDVAKRLMDYGFHAPTMSLPGPRHADDRADRERVEGASSTASATR